MIKIIPVLLCVYLAVLFSCGSKSSSNKETPEASKKEMPASDKKETPESIAQQWCDLNGKVYAAAEGADKATAEAARKKFETEMQERYKDNQPMLDNVGKAIEACEDASEGRK